MSRRFHHNSPDNPFYKQKIPYKTILVVSLSHSNMNFLQFAYLQSFYLWILYFRHFCSWLVDSCFWLSVSINSLRLAWPNPMNSFCSAPLCLSQVPTTHSWLSWCSGVQMGTLLMMCRSSMRISTKARMMIEEGHQTSD